MSRPVVSASAERIYAALGAYHEGDEAGGWLLLHLCEAIARTLAKPTEVLRHDDTGSGWRRALDPARTPAWMLPWLAQFVGTTPPGQITDEQLRELVSSAPRLRRGSLAAITAAARLYLADDDSLLHIFERLDGDAYYLGIATYTSHVTDAEAFELAIREQIPIGIVLRLTIAPGWTVGAFLAATDEYPTVGDFLAGFPTVADFVEHIPS